MKAKHHFWSSLALGGLCYYLTTSPAAFSGAMVGGFLIDADHVADQLWSIYQGAPHTQTPPPLSAHPNGWRAFLTRYVRRRKLVRMPLLLHAYEWLSLLLLLTLLAPTPFRIGLLAGYALHLALDLYRHHNEFLSPLFYSLLYRLAHGFRRDQLIKTGYR
ncbi:MAG: hypothetical protein HY231_16560 [Acidobacteria bacterium]|nr:hypothetical protein [Acidobacteriota bacterium]